LPGADPPDTIAGMDAFAEVDVAGLLTTYAASPTLVFNGNADTFESQDVVNVDTAGGGTAIVVSFDGVTDHGKLGIDDITRRRLWTHHKRTRIWLRRTDAASLDQVVQVCAWN
jgi:hypothetical protein